MGVLHGREVLYSIPKLFMNDIGDICKGLAQLSNMQPTIDVDVSNVSYKVGKDAQSVANYLVKCAKIGVKFIPVCDGRRPISKQAKNVRDANREKSRIHSHHLRIEILTLERRLKNDCLTDLEKNNIREEIAKKQRSMKSKETQSRNVIQPNFEAKLIEELEQTGAHSRNVAGGSVGHVIVAEFQADAVMMGHVCSQKTLMVMTDDADIPIIAGDDCIAIKFYTKDGDIELVSTSLKTLQKAEQFLSAESKERTQVLAAKQPIFEGIADRKLRALMCLFLGCDVYPKGKAGVGAKTLSNMINVEYPKFSEKNENVTLFQYLKQNLWEGTDGDDFDSDVVSTYIDAIVYEPTNEAADVDKDEDDESTLPPLMQVREDDDDDIPPVPCRTYLDDPPTQLPKYLEEYAHDITTILNGPAMERCKGVGANSHPFLCADGYDKCKGCAEVICRHCREEFDDDTYCLPCFAAESLVPEANVEEGKSISDMREELKNKYGVEKANELTVDEVEDLYALKEIATARISELLKDVEFPVHPSSEMDADVTAGWDTIMDIKFGEGGAFISDPDLDSQLLPGILKFFASLVCFESKEKSNEKDPAIHDAMPAMFIELAQKCRVDTGYRLLMRCVRHAFDSRCKSMDKGEGSLIMDQEGEIGIRLGHKVPASMRKNIYDTEIVLTAMKLLCCKCTCQCGSQGKEKIACVHTLVLPYLLTVLLIEDMAEHMLIALAARINGSSSESVDDADQQWIWSMSNWSDDQIDSMKRSVITLMEAAGESTSTSDCNKSLPELLHTFVVGTERRKEWNERSKVQAKPSELGPVKDMKFMSTARRAKLVLRREENKKPPSHDDKPPSSSENCVNANDGHPCMCSYPNCTVTESTSPPQTREECKMPTCSKLSHRMCQDQAEAENNWIHCENEPYCYECHPKECDPDTSSLDANFTPDYLKIAGLMKVSGCDMDDSKCVGFRLLSYRCVEQMGGSLQKLNLAEKEAKNEWKHLQELTLKRTMNATKTQLDNLKKPPAPKALEDPAPMPQQPVTPLQHAARRRGQQLPKRPVKTPMKRGKLIKCNKKGCDAHNSRNGMKNFKRVPSPPAKLKSTKPALKSVLNYYGRDLLRKEILRRMGLKDNDKRRDLYVCTLNHRFEEVIKRTDVVLPGKKKESRAFRLIVPEACAHKSSLKESTNSLGLGRDRALNKRLTEMQTNINDVEVPPDFSFEDVEEELSSAKPASPKEKLEHSQEETIVYKAKAEYLQAELLRSNMGRIQDWEQQSNEQHLPINPSLKRTLGMDVHSELPSFVSPTKFFQSTPQPPKKKKAKKSKDGPKQQKPRHENVKDSPTITLAMPDDEVKRRTGFPTMQHMLSYIFIVCNGELEVITERRTVLTWLEEWFMHFEYKWGRTLTRMGDIPAVYGPNKRFLIRAVALKYNIERRARNSWPTYASYQEDRELRNSDKWEAKYGGIRPVMWDMTNIPAYGFSDADFNRMTYSKYYAMNCFKGGIFCQLCGWIGTADLWTGAVSDTDYNKRAGYIQEQEQYQNNDLVNDGVIPFTNIYDKGYRAKMVAWRAGKQRVLQPVWAESDRRFRTDETLLTASVATDRGANERAVNVCKRSWFVSKGFQQNASAKQLDDAWMTWSFQSNFMFNPVL